MFSQKYYTLHSRSVWMIDNTIRVRIRIRKYDSKILDKWNFRKLGKNSYVFGQIDKSILALKGTLPVFFAKQFFPLIY